VQTFKEQEFAEVVSRLKKRDVDNARIREQRDQLQAELTERKHLESVKLASVSEMKVLAESRSVCSRHRVQDVRTDGDAQERIAVLQSELRRLKARLAAQAGDEDLMNFILNQSDVDVDYIQDLRTRLKQVFDLVIRLVHLLTLSQEF